MQDPKLVILGLVVTGLATVITALLVYIAANSKNRNERRRDTIADRDGLIAGLQASLVRVENAVAELRKEVAEVKIHNGSLITFINKLINVLRQNNLEEHIPSPTPDGINL